MARVLYTSWISTFGRKVAMGMELKNLPYNAVDALRRDFRSELIKANPRAEVPVLLDDDITVVNSSDILQYLDWRYPEQPLYPLDIKERVVARSLERLADSRLDPIVVDCSFWHWAERNDVPPPGLIEAGQEDLDKALAILEEALECRQRPWPFGRPGVVECAWFPNLVALKHLGLGLNELQFPSIVAWLDHLRAHPVFASDRKRTAAMLKSLAESNHERRRLFWSGDRMEWLMSRGFHGWFINEINEGRVAFPE